MSLLQTILGFIAIWAVTLFIHELGHYVYYWLATKKRPTVYIDNWDIKKDMAICVGTEKEFGRLSDYDKRGMLLTGVGWGLIPLFVYFTWLTTQNGIESTMFQIALSIGWYFLGSQSDCENIWILNKRIWRKNETV